MEALKQYKLQVFFCYVFLGVNCDPLESPANGNLRFTGNSQRYMMNSVAIYTCDENFEISGDAVALLVCLSSGEWSHPPPQCSPLECDTIPEGE